MRVQMLAAVTIVSLLSACASGGSSPKLAAEQQCGGLVRSEGLRLVQIEGVDAQGADTQVVRMRVEDALGRRFNATCAVAANGAPKWNEPLPSNIRRS